MRPDIERDAALLITIEYVQTHMECLRISMVIYNIIGRICHLT